MSGAPPDPSGLHEERNAMDRLLGTLLARTVDFVKFAEAKNAALLTFSSVWVIGIVNTLLRTVSAPIEIFGLDLALKLAVLPFLAAACLAMTSFLPELKSQTVLNRSNAEDNLLYWGVASKYSTEFGSVFRDKYIEGHGHGLSSLYIQDLADQVVITSRIAHKKYRLFNLGALLVIAGLITLGVPFISAAWKAALPAFGGE